MWYSSSSSSSGWLVGQTLYRACVYLGPVKRLGLWDVFMFLSGKRWSSYLVFYLGNVFESLYQTVGYVFVRIRK